MIEKLRTDEDVVSLYTSSGDHMIMIETWFRTSDELSHFVKKIEAIEGVTRICPAIIVERLK